MHRNGGIRAKSATARAALEKMQTLHLDHLAAVDGEQKFQFMLSRDEILSKVVTAVVLSQPAKWLPAVIEQQSLFSRD